VTPQGFVSLTQTAREQTYRPEGASVAGASQPTFYAPVGTYTPGDVTGTADRASYVPFGTYDAVETRVAQDSEHEGQYLRPSFSGRGIVLAAPGAITTLSAMGQARPDARIDVVRVRVDGVKNYSPASIDRIERVAAAITDLGLEVRVVAGSSLEPVAVYLPQYFDEGTDLGWTMQEWTSLGAAVRVERASTGATTWLMVITLVGVTALAAVSQAATVSTRRRETALLLSLGWSRPRVHAWFLAEGAIGVLLVVLAAAAALTLNDSPLIRMVAAAAVMVYAVLVFGGSWMGTQTTMTTGRRKTVAPRPARTVRAIGARSAATRPTLTALTGTALVVLATTATAFAATAVAAREAAGSTRLAVLLTTHLFLPQTVLASAAAVAGVVLFVIGTRAFQAATAAERLMLASSGWSGGDIARSARATVTRATAPAVAFAAVLSLALGTFLAPRDVAVVLLPAGGVLVMALGAALVHATLTSHRVLVPVGRAKDET